MAIEISDFRISFIWVEVSIRPLENEEGFNWPLAILTRRHSYAACFEQIVDDQSVVLGRTNSIPRFQAWSENGPIILEPPWPRTGKQGFWHYYLEKARLNSVRGKTAWNALVPLRYKPRLSIISDNPSFIPLLEFFFLPHALALVLTFRLQGRFDLDQSVDLGFGIRQSKFGLHGISANSGPYSLNDLVDQCFTMVEPCMREPGSAPWHRTDENPFSIFTVIQGNGVVPSSPIENGKETHRALEALTSWRSTWREDPLANLDSSVLRKKIGPLGHVFYGQTRGRAVWFPGLFTMNSGTNYSLGAYHRNLVFASLQVESLGGLTKDFARYLDQGKSPSPTMSECARHAAGILGRMYGGDPSTYRSWSMRAQIDQNNLDAKINQVRQFYGMSKLDIPDSHL